MRQKKPFIPAPIAKSCGKNRYHSCAEAKKVAREQEMLFSSSDLKLKVYHCPMCGGWHLTKRVQDDSGANIIHI